MTIRNFGADRWPNINPLASRLVDALVAKAESLRIIIDSGPLNCRIIDCGIDCPGGLEAGLRVGAICMGGLGTVRLVQAQRFPHWPCDIQVHSSNPVLACLGSQYAGWNLKHGDFFALGSGPGRAQAGREDLFKELKYQSQGQDVALVIEADKPPPAEVVEKVAADCQVEASKITFILTPTTSLAGTVQIIARVLEVALHKVHALKFPLDHIVDGIACAPLAPPASDFITAMGRTNDAIIYGGHVHLFVSGTDQGAEKLAQELPSRVSTSYGQPFADIFSAVKGDFYAIDGGIFSPSSVIVTALDSGRSFHTGQCDQSIINASFGLESKP